MEQLQNVLEGDDQHQAHQQDEAGQVDVIFKFGGDLFADGEHTQGVDHQEEDLAAVLADTLCFADTFLFVRIIFQMIKRAEQKDNIKRLICISREVRALP